ncbi:NIPSNAP family protein [Cognatishimia sp. SS12]|uniref:NIPSNAP family protein n=1 Tax=Cognatishimia sp. SS12 TaxID=2979465 RepID=UPI00232CB29B|nr:NIPSNAP family protein [Cognatishimia sp. SS12]MDC0739295.1 NIPSNAP family protein [Cognatishimia sp. SS12]
MIYELRTYSCKLGTVQRQIAFYRAHGMAIQTRHLGQPVVFGAQEFGDVNSYVHIWQFASLADRDQKRAALQQDPDWQGFLKKSAEVDYLTAQHSTILTAPDFMLPG